MTEGARSLAAAAALALALAAACAHVEAPTGGPADETAPKLLVTQPDTNAKLTSFRGPAIFVFDEGLSEKGVEDAVNLSPATSRASIDKRGDEIRVEPRRGWETGRVYQVEVGPGIQDLFGNRTTERYRLVFSTGPEIPDTRFAGTVLERTTTRPSVGARVEAVLLPDSLVYSTVTDSAGGFTFAQVPAGDYLVRAYTDQNRSRELDEFEARDTARVRVAERDTAPPDTRLSVIRPDTSPPRATGATASADTVIEVRFDDFLDPTQPLAPAQVTVAGPGAPAVAEVRFAAFAEARTAADSTDPDAEGDT
ncbi:MAG TPA: Ig-like domain-containing protein, partial [Longimicrobium sp.]|nr:Ig-like domain-containing protein [Longimicrobium sp.]